MIGYHLAVVALVASTTFATPLFGSLWRRSDQISSKHQSMSQINSRDMNKAEVDQLPTCHNDALYKAFTSPDNAVVANDFCSVYIASSSFVFTTVTPTYTASVTLPAAGFGAATTGNAPTLTTSQPRNSTVATPLPIPEDPFTDIVTDSPLQAKRQLLPGLPGPGIPGGSGGVPNLPGAPGTPGTPGTPGASDAATLPGVLSTLAPLAQASASSGLQLSSACSCLVTPSTVVITWTVTTSADYTTKTYFAEGTGITRPTVVPTALTTPTTSRIFGGSLVTLPSPVPTQNTTSPTTATPSLSPGNSASGTGEEAASGGETATTSCAEAIPTGAPFPTLPSANGTISAGLPAPTGVTNGTGAAPYCSQPFVRGNSTFMARYMVRCAYSYSNLDPVRMETQSSYLACVGTCDKDPRCFGCSYQASALVRNCYIYNDFPLPPGQPDEGWDSASYVVGSNNGMKL